METKVSFSILSGGGSWAKVLLFLAVGDESLKLLLAGGGVEWNRMGGGGLF